MNRILPLIAFAAFSLSACEVKIGDDKPEEPYDVTVPIEKFSIDSFPFIDCSTSTMPLRNMVMLHLMDIPYRWGYDVVSGSQYSITWALPEDVAEGSAEHKALASALNPKMILCNGSHDAYVNLIDSVTDLIIDSRNISRNELEYSASRNVNIITRPLAWDAMVFIVHPSNRVKSLTVEQIQKIYTGEITNWKQVGGDDKVIHPYTRDPDSGIHNIFYWLLLDKDAKNLIDESGYIAVR